MVSDGNMNSDFVMCLVGLMPEEIQVKSAQFIFTLTCCDTMRNKNMSYDLHHCT